MGEELDDRVVNNSILIFDLDGTIVSTDKANFLAYQEAIKEIKKTDLSSFYSSSERFTRDKLKELLPMLNAHEFNKIIKKKNAVYYKYLQETSINASVLKVINKFSKTNKTILVTNGHKERADLVLQHHDLYDIFDYKFYKDDYNGGNNKFQYIVDYLKIDPNLAIVFENENAEIKKATLTGISKKKIFNLSSKGE